MIQALAYRLQEQALGGLKPATRRLLRSIAGDVENRHPIATRAERRIEALETGQGALERLLESFGPETVVVRDTGGLDLQSRS